MWLTSCLFFWIQLLCFCCINNSLTCLVKSKPVNPPIVRFLWPSPASFSLIFGHFKQHKFTTINLRNDPSFIRCWESNSRPFEVSFFPWPLNQGSRRWLICYQNHGFESQFESTRKAAKKWPNLLSIINFRLEIWANPGLFFVYFQSLQTNNAILAAN